MGIAEKRLNNSILRKQILKELNFLTEIGALGPGMEYYYTSTPEQIEAVDQQQLDFAKGAARTLKSSTQSVVNSYWDLFKEFKKASMHQISIALKNMGKDMLWILKHDPVTSACFVLDIFSVADPTGLADITQGVIQLYSGDYGSAGLSFIFGGWQLKDAVATVATEGAAIPLVLTSKAEVLAAKIAIKSGKGAAKIINILLDPKMLKIVEKLKTGSKEFKAAGEYLERMIAKAKKYDGYGITASNEEYILKDIIGGDFKKFDSAASSAARKEFDALFREQVPTQKLNQSLAFMMSVGTVTQTEPLIKEKIYEKFINWCKGNTENCDLFNINRQTLMITPKAGINQNSEDLKFSMSQAERVLEIFRKEVSE